MNLTKKLYKIQMKKQKGQKEAKRNALSSFLQAPTRPADASQIKQQKKPLDDKETYEEYTEQFNNCNVCGNQLDAAKKKKCEFCSMPACNDHLRKKRKKKGKWQRICDHCQDKYLYDAYMKLQQKAQDSLLVEQEITLLKHDNFLKQVKERRQKRRQIGFKTMSLQSNYQEQLKRIANEEKLLAPIERENESNQLILNQMQIYLQRVSDAFRQNHEQSWNILSQENARMAKELTKLQKKAMEIKSAIAKKEKEIQNAFQEWQQRQFKKKLENQEKAAAAKKKQNCQIY